MAREIELKILDVDPAEMELRLDSIGAVALGEELQRIYTYDFAPYWSIVPGIAETIRREETGSARDTAIQHLRAILVDLDDLLDDRKKATIAGESRGARPLGEVWDTSLMEGKSKEFLTRLVEDTRDLGINPNKWVRLRSSSSGATIAVKQIFGRRRVGNHREHGATAVSETELSVNGFEAGRDLLEALGFFPKNYQEKLRSKYLYGKRVNIDIDKWPLIPAYLEIEAPTEQEIFDVGLLLGLKAEGFRSMNADDVFSSYGIDMYGFKELRFELERQG